MVSGMRTNPPRNRICHSALFLGFVTWATLRASDWHWETVLAVLGAHAAILVPLGWIAWLFWAGRRPGDGG